ncbi:MAG: SDR family NAD(P)-dependent oxidoreductase [Actinomycetota bacterium]|nr:SDR family NAD(P)-dependent oxidoreductase [Actinomycetota bacterium]
MTSNLNSFDGQTVLIVGAASGIGRATATLIQSRGGKVIIVDVDISGLNSLAKELLLDQKQVKSTDLGNQESIKTLIASVIAENAQIHAVINSAGVVGPTNTKAEDIEWAAFERTVTINLFGAIWLTQAILPHMKANKYGRIAHVASIAGKEGNPGMHAYNTSKAGMIGFIKGIGKEVASEGIVINALAPAVIRTPMNADTSDATLKYMLERIPMGRVGEPEEAAEMLAFMASRACSFTTGFTFDASGGRATY